MIFTLRSLIDRALPCQRPATVVLAALFVLPMPVAGTPDEDTFTAYAQPVPGSDEAIDMVPIQGGKFLMGSPQQEPGRTDAEGPRHEVSVSAFWMSQYEISWQQYEAFVAERATEAPLASPQQLKALAIDGVTGATAPYEDMSFGMGKDNRPAAGMTQYAAQMYARWLSASSGVFYRLPTEAEWEYACRAGTNTAWSFGDDAGEAGRYIGYLDNSDDGYHPRGSRAPNPWQLYDMHGNVAEWTLDAFTSEGYGEAARDNPWQIPAKLYPRVARGGSWDSAVEQTRCASRLPSGAEWKERDPQLPKSRWWHTNAPFIGFRLVRPRVQPDAESIRRYWLEPIDDYGI